MRLSRRGPVHGQHQTDCRSDAGDLSQHPEFKNSLSPNDIFHGVNVVNRLFRIDDL
jgi:hypothetical protein